MCIRFWKKKDKHQDQFNDDKVAFKFEKRIDESPFEIQPKDILIVEPVLEPENESVEAIRKISEDIDTEDKINIQKYHVSQNKDKDADNYMKWRVRKESSNKTIQYFDTQKLAIDYAQDLALKAGSSVVIHKLNGAIRRQDYSKKN
ncbi:MAG: DUF2188 domain-containing protein [Acholeplasma sp.]